MLMRIRGVTEINRGIEMKGKGGKSYKRARIEGKRLIKQKFDSIQEGNGKEREEKRKLGWTMI